MRPVSEPQFEAEPERMPGSGIGALSGPGLINMALERPDAALRAFEQVLEIHPNSAGARAHVKRLRDILKGDET